MTRAEARRLAKELHRAGVECVRVVEHIGDGEHEILVQRNSRTLSTAADVAEYMPVIR